jgi:Mor family transcriptional regulator
MKTVTTNFQERVTEIERYFLFLQEFDNLKLHDDPFNVSSENIPKFLSSDKDALFKTLKANGFILLYNLVESTLKNSIEAIYEEFKSNTVSFDVCSKNVRKIILSNLKKHNVDNILPSLVNISLDMVFATFRKDELFSGNVDGKRVRDVAKSYGFEIPRSKSDALLTVKSNRNDLAHGDRSFSEVGRDFDIVRLEKIKKEIIRYLKALITNIDDYIRTKAYLAQPQQIVI